MFEPAKPGVPAGAVVWLGATTGGLLAAVGAELWTEFGDDVAPLEKLGAGLGAGEVGAEL